MRRLMTLAVGFTFSTAITAQIQVPRPVAPGVEFSKSKDISGLTNTLAQTKMLLSAPKYKTAPQAPRLMETTADISTKDTLLVTGHIYKDFWSTDKYWSESITYDKYGRRAMLTTYGTDGEKTGEKKYTYEVGPFNYWTKKLVQQKYTDSNEWEDLEKEEREIDDNGNLTRRKSYGVKEYAYYDEATNDWISEKKMMLISDARYDYAHTYLDENDHETKGALVEFYSYRDDGNVDLHQKYQWADCVKKYIMVLSESDVKQMTATIGEDYITEVSYHNDGTVKEIERTYYYDNGVYLGRELIVMGWHQQI